MAEKRGYEWGSAFSEGVAFVMLSNDVGAVIDENNEICDRVRNRETEPAMIVFSETEDNIESIMKFDNWDKGVYRLTHMNGEDTNQTRDTLISKSGFVMKFDFGENTDEIFQGVKKIYDEPSIFYSEIQTEDYRDEEQVYFLADVAMQGLKHRYVILGKQFADLDEIDVYDYNVVQDAKTLLSLQASQLNIQADRIEKHRDYLLKKVSKRFKKQNKEEKNKQAQPI